MTIVLLIAGLVVLVLGADLLVRGAAKMAAGLGIAPLVIGLTIVAFGTSAPEMVVSTVSAFSGNAEIAVGNVVGSNIFNVLFILGISAVIVPLAVSAQLIRIDVPIMIAISAITWVISLDGGINRMEGFLLFGGIIAYTVLQIRLAKKEKAADSAEFEKEFGPISKPTAKDWVINLASIAAGLVLLIVGSNWLVESSVEIAKAFGVSNLVIGLTIVAAGTSLPEVATSIVASIKGERDIAVGNVVGSNIFNILAVLGSASILSPSEIPVSQPAIDFDIPVMIAVAVACLPIFISGQTISRWEGAVFLAYYIAYTAYLVMTASGNEELQTFENAMKFVVLPLTGLTLLVIVTRHLKQQKTAA